MNPQEDSRHTVIRDLDDLHAHFARAGHLNACVIHGIDLRQSNLDWNSISVKGTVLLGCALDSADGVSLFSRGAVVIPRIPGLPYDPFRTQLYTWQELMEGHGSTPENGSRDRRIYDHFSQSRFNPDMLEALNQRIHDHAVDAGLRDLLGFNPNGMTKLKPVGFMGGHGVCRSDPWYLRAAQTARLIAREGYFVVSGGGPGIMEAANLGAWMSAYDETALEEAVKIMSAAPTYKNLGWFESAREVLKRWPEGTDNLAVPTWFYGHEPSNLFATRIAKYFSNSIREDTLLAMSLYGIVFAPGSAGTTQEIFQEAAQNHYGTYNFFSPMVFLSTERYEIDTLIYPLLRQLSFGREYHDMLYICNEPADAAEFIFKNPPVQLKA